MRQHTQEEPYSCKVCNQKFRDQANRDDHLRRHFKIKPYICKFCDKNYYRKYLLKNHLMKKHSIKDDLEECILYEKNK